MYSITKLSFWIILFFFYIGLYWREDSKIIVPAIDRDDNIFEVHPISNVKLIGYEIPHYDKVVELINECAKTVKEVKYIGWGVAIMEDDVCVIEGNCYPGIYQIKLSFLKEKKV